MGNRAVVTFDKEPTGQSIGVYLHWNGGAESILAFLEACDRLAVRDDDDPSYQLARFIQIIGNFFGGTTSIGVGKLRELDVNNGDNGIFRVSRSKDKVRIWHGVPLVTGEVPKKWTELKLEDIKKHSYWQTEPGDADPVILKDVLKDNAAVFGKNS